MEPRERDKVDSELAKVSIKLARETEAAGDTTHRCRDEVVQVSDCSKSMKKIRTYLLKFLFNDLKSTKLCVATHKRQLSLTAGYPPPRFQEIN